MKRPKLLPRDEYFPQQLHRIHERARMARLNDREFGVYRFLVDLMWLRWEHDGAGELENDPRWLAGQLRMTVRSWNAVMAGLVAQGLFVVDAAYIRDAHTAESIAARRTYARERSESGSKGGRATQRNRNMQAHKDAIEAAEVRRRIEARAHRETGENSRETFSSRGNVHRGKPPAHNKNKSLPQAELQAEPPAEPPAILNTEYNQQPLEPVSAREGKDDEWETVVAGYRANWQSRQRNDGQGALKLGPVVIASNAPPASSGATSEVAVNLLSPKAAAS